MSTIRSLWISAAIWIESNPLTVCLVAISILIALLLAFAIHRGQRVTIGGGSVFSFEAKAAEKQARGNK
jgi:uncharacterized membrane protein YhiD involved in acid resistance